jgi:hypothetical protein
MERSEVGPEVLGSNAQRALGEVLVEPLDQEVAEEELVAGHVPEEQRLPELERAAATARAQPGCGRDLRGRSADAETL